MAGEILELEALQCVVKHLSYAKAADELDMSPSGVSRAISRLEDRLGVRLLQRTTRKLAPTEAGTAFSSRISHILLDLADAEGSIQEKSAAPRGRIRVSAPVVFGQLYVAPLVVQLAREFPQLSIDLRLVDRFVDLVEEGIDLAIRIGVLGDSRLIARRLCRNQRVLVASPNYLEKYGAPSTAAELSEHECVLFTGFSRPREWKLIGPGGESRVPVSGRVSSNNIEVLATSAKEGLGITIGAMLSVGPALSSGELVRVLPEYELETTAIYAVYPSARQLSSKVRATVDFLSRALRDPPSWEMA